MNEPEAWVENDDIDELEAWVENDDIDELNVLFEDVTYFTVVGPKGDTGAPGKDGHSPVVTATKSGKTTTISVDGAAIATVEDGVDGKPGVAGSDGITPHIGDNGNWFIGAEDTGKPSRGAIGAPGKDGNQGAPGKDGAPGIYYGTTQPAGDTHPVWIDPDGDHDDGGLLPAVTTADNGKVLRVVSGAWSAEDMPDNLPNPNALTFTGDVTGSYDGSKPLSVNIPTAPTKTSQLTNDSGFLTSHQDISGKQDKATLEADVAAKGFTKNTGTYSKPAGGIPKSDLDASVQTSLGKADTALQEHQSLAAYRTAAAQDIIDNGKQDKITSTNKLAYSLISGTPTIPTVPTNVSAFTNDAGYLTLATLPKYEGVVE